jgi:hypothetical protein
MKPGDAGRIRLIDSRLQGHGQIIFEEAQAVKLPPSLACALVERESGGANVFGCDKSGPFITTR